MPPLLTALGEGSHGSILNGNAGSVLGGPKPVDLMLVDPSERLPIGRPWLTVAIDVMSRAITGFHLSQDAPSATSVGLCLTHMATDKKPWIAARGVTDLDWPIAGKSTITEKLLRRHNRYTSAEGDRQIVPVLSVQMPPDATVGRFHALLLDSLGAPVGQMHTADRRGAMALNLMRTCEVRLLLIDELHNVLCVTSSRQRDLVLRISPAPLRYGSRCPAPQICRAAAGDGSKRERFQGTVQK